MMGRAYVALAIAVLLNASASAIAASAAAPCVAPDANARLVWPAAGVRAARLYFRSDNAKADHYVEMRRVRSGRYVGLLPKPEQATRIDYRIATADSSGTYATRDSGSLAVSAECASPALPPEDAGYATALVVGSTADGPAIPVGFSCAGIIGRITPGGELSAYDACSEVMLATLAGVRKTVAKGAANNGRMIAENSLGVGVVEPEHHRRPRRAPIPVTPPNPRVVEPVSPSRP